MSSRAGLLILARKLAANLIFFHASLPKTHGVPMAHSLFCEPTPAHARLLRLISKAGTQFETHILRCAEWTGQAIADLNSASAFVKAAIALEVLFKADEKGVITSSIMAQIAESCAFLLAENPIRAFEIEAEIKHLYSIRSSIVHTGKDSVADRDLNTLIGVCRHVVDMLLSSEEFAEFENMGQLGSYFKSKKYGILRNVQSAR
jgi:hypothetical protein